MTARTISAAKFKAQCLKLMDEVNRTGDEIVITKRGKPVARLTRPGRPGFHSLFGSMKGTVTVKGDIISPLDVEWEALKD